MLGRRWWRASLCVLVVLGAVGTPVRRARADPAPEPAKLDLNSATLTELDGLPGVGRKKAEAIVARRQTKPFQRVTELLRVKGFGPKLFVRVRPLVEVRAVEVQSVVPQGGVSH